MSESGWWRDAVIYQVYPRSFADGDGDGVGDLSGFRARLPYVAGLGADAIWISPWYPSPMADGGYDIADHRDIDPVFGTLAEAEKLIEEAHALGLRIIVDVVPNHCSDRHPWFAEALAAGPGSPLRERFWFRPGRGARGELPPNDWPSIFGGPAWTPAGDGEWYLHLFAPEQPDFNWNHPAVRAEFLSILRFWFERGVDGVRIDSAAVLVKDPDAEPDGRDPYTDRDGVHAIYKEWRRVADAYGGRVLIGEIWLPDRDRFAAYLAPDELHTAFNFAFLGCPWEPRALRRVIDDTLASHLSIGAPPTWVLSNHDVIRTVTRFGRADTSFDQADRRVGAPTDLRTGTRRARAAALLSLALPGSAYVYQGEELGLWEVEDLPDGALQDPIWERSGHRDRGRDGCRVPLPWAGGAPPFGFGPGAPPWLPQPAAWRGLTAERQDRDPGSMLALYRAAVRLRRERRTLPGADDHAISWLALGPEVLAFRRADGLTCAVNLGSAPVRLPPGRVLLASQDPVDGTLPEDTAVWLKHP